MSEQLLPDPELTVDEARALARGAGLLSSALDMASPHLDGEQSNLQKAQVKLELSLMVVGVAP